jgi:membrane-associated phospholipid phosphatase
LTSSIDDAVVVWVAKHRFGPADHFFIALGNVEKLGAIWIACALVLGVTWRRGIRWTGGLVLVAALVTFAADSVSFGVKDLVHRTRPFVAHPQIHPLYVVHSSSFPAGHAATAFAGATLLTYVAPRLWPLFGTVAVAIAFSRIYVGAHYPTDVLAGAALGVAVAGVAIVFLRVASSPWSGRCRGRGTATPRCCAVRASGSSRVPGSTSASRDSSLGTAPTSPASPARFP